MDPTATRTLGRTGVAVTQLGYGAAPLGNLFSIVPEEEAAATLAAAWDAGIRYFDTAPWYGRGQSEHRVGRGLYQRPREAFVLSTKVGRVLRAAPDLSRIDTAPWAGGLPFGLYFDYSYDGIMRSFEDSLQRLGLARIDLLVIHDLDLLYHKTEVGVAAHLARLFDSGWRALRELKDAGVIGGVGAGINELGMIPRFLDLLPLDFFVVAMPYTLLDQEVLDAEFPRLERDGVGVVIGAVFASGVLATGAVPGAKYRYADLTPDIADKVARMQAVCARHDVPLAAAALQFPLGHPCVASVIPGGIGAGQVARNVASFRHPIPADLWAELRHEGLLRADAPTP
jgi:D-threo-aldose 1-dehydrogenase